MAIYSFKFFHSIHSCSVNSIEPSSSDTTHELRAVSYIPSAHSFHTIGCKKAACRAGRAQSMHLRTATWVCFYPEALCRRRSGYACKCKSVPIVCTPLFFYLVLVWGATVYFISRVKLVHLQHWNEMYEILHSIFVILYCKINN